MKKLLFALMLVPALMFSQSTTGTILGTVKDVTGAVVAGAKVVLTNEGTGIKAETVTNNSGDYQFTNLTAATYMVEAELKGFRKAKTQGIQLLLNATVRTDVKLEPGSVEQSITVTAEATTVNSESSSISGVVDQHMVQNLPLDGRTLDAIVLLTPGLTSDSASNPRIGGSQYWGGNFYSVDGVAFNDAGNGGGAYSYSTKLTTTPSVDTVQEVKVESNNARAEHEGSAAISMISRGGANRFAGSLYEFNRNRATTAKNFFAMNQDKPQFNRNEFGGTASGPIIRNRTFFFGSYEGLRQRTGRPPSINVPTLSVRGGDFGRTTVRDPLSGVAFPNNVIPSTRFDPRSVKLLAFYPEPNTTGAYNYNGNVLNKFDVNRYSLKIDDKPSAKDSLSLTMNYSKGDPYFIARGTPANYGNWANGGYTTKSAALAWTRTLTPRTVNEARLSYFSHASVRQGQNLDFNPQSIFPGLYGNLPLGGLPYVTITGYTTMGDYGGSDPSPQITIGITDNYTFVRNKHTFKAGVDAAFIRIASNPTVIGYGASPASGAGLGLFNFNGRYTGNGFGDFLLGYPVNTGRAMPTLVNLLHNSRWSAYFQDDWKPTSKLTLNIGLRYMVQTQMLERDGSGANFDFATGTLVVRTVDNKLPRLAIQRMLNAYPWEGSEKHGWGSDLTLPDHNNFEPRFGFAYRPFNNNKTVLRGGYGIYLGQIPAYIGLRQITWSNVPYQLSETYEAAAGNTPTLTLANPFPGDGSVSANPTLTAVNRQLRNSTSQQWNLTIERQLLPGTILRVTYLGNKATRVPFYNYNRNMPIVMKAGTIQSNRPYQPWADISTLDTNGNAFTNQFQAELTRRFRNGLYVMSNFTLNKAIDNVPVSASPQNPYNAANERGNMEGVRQLVFNNTITYPIPLGVKFWRGNWFSRNLIGGWNLSTITTFRSGLPFSVTYSPTVAGWYSTRADATGISPNVDNPSINQWFNPAAFKIPAQFTFGNSARNNMWGPGQMKIDLGITKDVKFMERYTLNVRAEAFNLPNHPSFGNPSASMSSPSTMGRIGGTSVDNRAVQVALKLKF